LFILWRFGLFYGPLVDFMDIWYNLWEFCIFFPHFGTFYKKNPATLAETLLPLLHAARAFARFPPRIAQHEFLFSPFHFDPTKPKKTKASICKMSCLGN
jgi:hypothetical protein